MKAQKIKIESWDMRRNQRSFTLVELMTVIAIVLILITISFVNVIKSKITSNDAAAKSSLRTISTAAETFNSNGMYPTDMSSLTSATPPYLNQNFCGTSSFKGFVYDCTLNADGSGYTFSASPLSANTGTTTYTITTGGVLTP